MALDPFCGLSGQASYELFQYHAVDDSLEVTSRNLRQESQSCWPISKGQLLSPRPRERNRWRMAHFRSLKTRRFWTGSCWAATCASSDRRGMRCTGHWSSGHTPASAVFLNRSKKTLGSSWASILFNGRWVGAICSRNLPVNPAPELLAVCLLGLDEGMEPSLLVFPQGQQCFMMFSMQTRERLYNIRKWRSWR
ncbi:hypothetical protein PO909_024363 [Leuciscus waleckii]